MKSIEGTIVGEERKVAIMLDDVSNWAFGPLFQDSDEVERFLVYLQVSAIDPRMMNDEELESAVAAFRAEPSA